MIDLVLKKHPSYGTDTLLIRISPLECPQHGEPLEIIGPGEYDSGLFARCPTKFDHAGKDLHVQLDWQYEPTTEYRRSYP